MKHEEIKKLLPLYVDNGLSDTKKSLVEKHLESCPECQRLLKEYQNNHALLSSVDDLEVPDNFYNETLEKIRREYTDMRKERDDNQSIWEKLRKAFTSRVQIPAGIIAAAILLAVIIPAIIFSNPSTVNDFASLNNYGSGNYRSNYAPTADTMVALEQEQSVQKSALGAEQSIETAEIERKIIQRAYLTIEVEELDIADNHIMEIIQNYNGYIASSREWESNERKHSRYQLRIPAAQFNNVISEITDEDLGYVVSRSISGQDVTEEYIDLEARLTNLTEQEKRYRQLLDKAETVEDILKIENELTRIRSSIESLQGRLKYLDNQVSMSTIEVEFREIITPGVSNWGINQAFKQAIEKMSNSIYQIITFTGSLIPYLIILLIIYGIYRYRKRS
ncbi:MAG TPA: DUF4349 domain-containing protein [Halanaerobiales bacterium]|nr:DUF4349 domain-containing protein [Halanaerobiales bacterium]